MVAAGAPCAPDRRWALLAALAVFVLLVLLRKPLADWFWDEPQIEQLLAEGIVHWRLGA